MVFLPKGVLGINARNLLFIKPFNKRKNILFADDKLKTKHFLAARGISVPRLYGVIRNKEELDKFDFSNLPNSFALKPNLGSGGQGIIPISGRAGNNFITSSGRSISIEMLKEHIIDIIDGRFSVNNNPDSAFFEQLIITHDALKPYTYKGLPDIRVVVFNLIPVMAMLRLPTKQSDGKANLQQGAVGVGIDLAKGETTYIAQKYNIIPEIPDIGPMKIRIPEWDKVLDIAVKTQLITNLGYMAADICMDQNSGPVLLEINARAGLKVQIANMAGLYKRLERVKGIKVTTPEKGIRVAKDLFGNVAEKTITNISGKTIIGNKEIVEILNDKSNNIVTTAEINLNQAKTTVHPRLAEQINNFSEDKKLKIIIAKQRITTLAEINSDQTATIVIGRRDLAHFLVDPSKEKQSQSSLPKAVSKPKSQNNFYFKPAINYAQIDHDLYELDRQVKLVSHLTPTNLDEELTKFKADNSYNPQFQYKESAVDFYKVKEKLANILTDESALGQVFRNKKNELLNRFNLIEAIGTDSFTETSLANFGGANPGLIQKAMQMLQLYLQNQETYPETVNAKKAKDIFEQVLAEYGLDEWQVKLKKAMNSNCSVSKGQTVFIKQDAKFSQFRIDQLIAHEIETHILTNENGRRQPYRIFQIGTANYLKTQEGIAVYNQEKFTKTVHNLWGAGNFIATYLAEHHSFSETYLKLLDLGLGQTRALNLATKCKRGLENTERPGAFTKGYIYFAGANQIDDFVQGGGNLADLYIGKIDLESLDLINTIDNLNKPYLLPSWYK